MYLIQNSLGSEVLFVRKNSIVIKLDYTGKRDYNHILYNLEKKFEGEEIEIINTID